jgi:hypothetical protein
MSHGKQFTVAIFIYFTNLNQFASLASQGILHYIGPLSNILEIGFQTLSDRYQLFWNLGSKLAGRSLSNHILNMPCRRLRVSGRC